MLRLRPIFWVAVIALLPTIITLGLLWGVLQVDFYTYTPTFYGVYNDAFYYWRQIYTFSEVGLQGGYYTAFEYPALADYSHYYFYGPWYPGLYGTAGKLLGWYAHTPIVFNMAIISLALGLYAWWFRHHWQHLLWASTVSVMLPGILLYIPTNMQESVHYTLAIVLAIPISVLLRERDKTSRLTLFVLGSVAFFASLMRPTWLVIFIILFLFYSQRLTLWHWFITGVRLLPVVAFIGLIIRQHAAPYIAFQIIEEGSNIGRIIQNTLERAINNLASWNSDLWSDKVHRYQILVLLISLPQRFSTPEILFHLLNMGLPQLSVILFYSVSSGRDLRHLVPHLLLSVLLLVEFRQTRLLKILFLMQLVILPFFIGTYADLWQQQFQSDQTVYRAFAETLDEVVVYDAQARNAWCNTLLVMVKDRAEFAIGFPPELMWLDGGIGISFQTLAIPVETPYKSRYILLDEEDVTYFGLNPDLQPLITTTIGTFYENTAAECR